MEFRAPEIIGGSIVFKTLGQSVCEWNGRSERSIGLNRHRLMKVMHQRNRAAEFRPEAKNSRARMPSVVKGGEERGLSSVQKDRREGKEFKNREEGCKSQMQERQVERTRGSI
jgi:hypothetical protein